MTANAPRNFIVTCHGWSASKWTAHTFSMHSDVICTHSAMNVLSTEIRNYDGLRDSVRKLHTGYVNRQQRPVDQSYDEIAGHGRAEAYGSVHLYRLRDLPILWERFGKPTRQFMVYNQIRHPL
ncbi:MAG: hypothetical protein KGY81_01365, partial [Phycisphaerae bacterium]|nr:hypothetical protein [Phycisphaerae bacterium]